MTFMCFTLNENVITELLFFKERSTLINNNVNTKVVR